MTLDDAVSQVVGRYMQRVQVRPGNGLSKNMNQTIRSYDQLPNIITRTASILARTEALFGFTGDVRIAGFDLYKHMLEVHDEWVREVPFLRVRCTTGSETAASGEHAGIVQFMRKPVLPYHQFTAAWAIARRIGMIQGRGEIGLHRDVLSELKRVVAVPSLTRPPFRGEAG